MVIVRDASQLAHTFRRIRKSKRLTQTDVATAAALRQATISTIESGDPEAKLSSILKLLDALNLELVVRERTTSKTDVASIF